VLAEIRRAVAVIVLSGRSTRAATSQPSGRAVAGLLPALRAARLSPTEALWTL